MRGFGFTRPEKRLGFTLSKLPLEDLQNRGPAEWGRGEETSPRTGGSNTSTKVDGLSTYPLFLGLTWGAFPSGLPLGRALGHALLGRNTQAELTMGIRVGSRFRSHKKG